MKFKSLFIIALSIFWVKLSVAQNVEFKSSNFKDNKEGLKAAQLNVEAGDESFKKAIKLLDEGKDGSLDFNQAIPPFKKANDFNPNNAELNYKLGKCLFFTGQPIEAIPFLKKALSLDEKNAEPDLYFILAKSLKLDNKFDEAKEKILKYKTVERSKILEKNNDEIARELQQCETAKSMVNKPLERIWVENMKDWNTENDDFGPTITADESLLLFNSVQPGQTTSRVLSTIREKGKWSPVKPFGDPFSTPGIFEALSLSFDGQSMYLYKSQPNGDIYVTNLEGDKWSSPLRLPDKINSPENETHACFSGDGIKIYYVTDQSYGNKGGKDIFFSGIMDRKMNQWGQGLTIGSEINTTLDDGFIFMHPDGKTIYFSSKGHNSMGGYDIFKSERLAGRWSEPVNMGYPINSTADETSFVMSASGKHAYLTSNRKEGKGGFDIYKVTFLGPVKEPVIDMEDQLLAGIASPQKEDKLEGSVKVESKNLTILKGRIFDDFTGQPLKAEIVMVDNVKNEVIATFSSNSATGKFLISLPAGKNYGIAVSAPDYLFHSENFDLPETSEYQLVEKDIRLKGVCIGCKIILKNIFFDTGKFNIRPESTAELTRLADLIRDIARVKPKIKIEISGHTDNVGAESSNQALSENRAKAVVQYLVEHGISKDKLIFKGYGSKEPVTSNNTPEGRQENRRTEFKILEN